MKLSGVLAVVCVATCGLFTTLVAPGTTGAAFLGMAAPLIVGMGTILLVEQTTRANIQALTSRMTIAFVAKMVFYATYVSVAIALLGIDPVPFTISFTFYFVALQITEALYFKTLFARTSANTAVN
ncbi:MAG TPA: hypothetical protein QF572_00720 [Vicinamibacterales bacterium]|jgi:hypothetical protein|nr:hypothetical protein [Vicinamibacterales bacterium]|tara:strand:- start:147 stop:524 length:378 start_codon:yes stop_codon:yes gene_type:complete